MNRRLLVAPVALVLTSLALSSLHMARFREVSVLDEFQHTDYAERLSHFDLPAPGSLIDEPTLREDACRGHQSLVVPPCDAAVLDPSAFPGGGYNSAAAHPPGYYVFAAAAGRLVEAAPGGASFISGARLASAIFLALGALALWWLLVMLGADAVVRFAAALSVATMPIVIHAGAIVSPDSTAVLLGAAVPAVVVGYTMGRVPAWVVVGASIALGLSKVTNLLVIGVVAVLVGVLWLGGRTSRAVSARALMLSAVPAFAVYTAWTAIAIARDSRPPGGLPVDRLFKATSLSAEQVWANLDAVFPPSGTVVVDRFAIAPLTAWAMAVGWVLVGSSFLAAASADSAVRGLGAGAITTAVLAGPFLVVFNYVVLDQYFPIDARYGIVLIPAMLIGLGVSLRGLAGRVIAVGLTAWGIAAFLVAYVPAR